MTDQKPITMAEAVSAGFCAKGQRKWAHSVGIDLARYIREGYAVEELYALAPGPVAAIMKLREVRGG